MVPSDIEHGRATRMAASDVFTVLSNRRRRHSLHYLLQSEGSVGLTDIAEQVAAWEHGIAVAEVTYDQRRNVYTALKQTHLPLMESKGFVEYFEDCGRVKLGPDEEEFAVYLDVVDRRRTIPWSGFYLALGFLAVILTCMLLVDVPPFDAVSSVVWVAVLAGSVLVSGTVHYAHDRRSRLGVDGPPPELSAIASAREE
jgi:hypothetical protein